MKRTILITAALASLAGNALALGGNGGPWPNRGGANGHSMFPAHYTYSNAPGTLTVRHYTDAPITCTLTYSGTTYARGSMSLNGLTLSGPGVCPQVVVGQAPYQAYFNPQHNDYGDGVRFGSGKIANLIFTFPGALTCHAEAFLMLAADQTGEHTGYISQSSGACSDNTSFTVTGTLDMPQLAVVPTE